MGGKSKAPQVQQTPQIDPVAQAQAQMQAQMSSIPEAARLQYGILSNPEYGMRPTTQLYQNIMSELYPQETGLRQQAMTSIGGALGGQSFIPPEQQAIIDTQRQQSVSDLQRAMRERAEMGGGLYGGRPAAAEAKSVGNLLGGYAEGDTNRMLSMYQTALQAALGLQTPLQQPQYVNPVVSPDTQYSGDISQRGQDYNVQMANVQNQIAQQQAQNQLYAALFQGLGSAAGGWMGGSAFNNLMTK